MEWTVIPNVRFFRIQQLSSDILRDLLTKYLYFKMLGTMSSSSVPKLEPINHYQFGAV